MHSNPQSKSHSQRRRRNIPKSLRKSNLIPIDKHTMANDENLINFNSVESNKWLETHLERLVYPDDAGASVLVEKSKIGCKLYPDVIPWMLQLLRRRLLSSPIAVFCCCCLGIDSESNFPKLHRLTIKLPSSAFLTICVRRACYFRIKLVCRLMLLQQAPRLNTTTIRWKKKSCDGWEKEKKSNSGNGTEEMNVQHKPKHKLDFVLLLCRLQSSKRERNEMKWDL